MQSTASDTPTEQTPKTWTPQEVHALPPVTVGKLTYPRTLGALDIETLGRADNSVVIELGTATSIVGVEVVDGQRMLRCSPITNTRYVFNVIDQIARGRQFDPQTFVFHIEQQGYEATMALIKEGLEITPEGTVQAFQMLVNHMERITECWINGLSFDSPIMSSLVASYAFPAPHLVNKLWSHAKERDVRTIHRTFPFVAERKQVAHRAVADATWNLETAFAYHQGLVFLAEGMDRVVRIQENRRLAEAAAKATHDVVHVPDQENVTDVSVETQPTPLPETTEASQASTPAA